ncbi:hypothetical protein PSEUDO8Z_10158 [Pseudomonas sp. 8Z]|nr:hypothetical protein PSEUDO8Z_10158 [Pseudomonas sp. 8Z]
MLDHSYVLVSFSERSVPFVSVPLALSSAVAGLWVVGFKVLQTRFSSMDRMVLVMFGVGMQARQAQLALRERWCGNGLVR